MKTDLMDKIVAGTLLSVLGLLVFSLLIATCLMVRSELRKQEAFDSCKAVKPLHECYTNIIMVD